jgi:hypothetical protein
MRAVSVSWVTDGGHQSTTCRMVAIADARVGGVTRNPARTAAPSILLNVPM